MVVLGVVEFETESGMMVREALGGLPRRLGSSTEMLLAIVGREALEERLLELAGAGLPVKPVDRLVRGAILVQIIGQS